MIRRSLGTTEKEPCDTFYHMLYGNVVGNYVYGQLAMMTPSEGVKLVYAPEIKDFADYMSRFTFSETAGYYYAKNPAVKPGTLDARYIYCFSNIVLDLDNHNEGYQLASVDRSDEVLAHILGHIGLCFEDAGLAQPNAIIATGRGYQVVWHFMSIPGSLVKMYRVVQDEYCKVMNDLLAQSEGVLANMVLDVGASKRAQGLYRLPGSIYPSTGQLVRVYVASSVPADFFREVDTIIPDYAITNAPTKSVQTQHQKSDWRAPGKARIENLTRLAECRGEIKMGYRDEYLFTLIQAMRFAGWSATAINNKVHDLNNTIISPPLSDNALDYLLQQGLKKTYKMSDQEICKRLAITDAEYDICFAVSDNHLSKNHARDEKRKAKRSARDTAVIEMHEKGATNSTIAKELGLNRRTVIKIIKERG